jgi:hypothetical protein
MYNPDPSQGSDAYYEYIELYNYGQQSLDLKNWLLSDDGPDVEKLIGFKNTTTIIQPEGYAVITDEDSLVDVPSTALHLSTGDNTICTNGLSNAGETITLFDSSGREVDSISYFPSWGANGNGMSLEKKIPDGENEQYNWGESLVFGGTPGEDNSVTDDRQTSSSPTTSTTTTHRSTTTTTLALRCSDGTKFGECSHTKPKYCSDGLLILRCSLCGCSGGYSCVKDACVKNPKPGKPKPQTEKNDSETLHGIVPPKGKTLNSEEKNASDSPQSDGFDGGSPSEPDLGVESDLTLQQAANNSSWETVLRENQGGFTGSSILSSAKNPKTAATIALSVIGGGYILHKKRKNAVVKAKLDELDRMAESEQTP